jgi:hypothetical protein
VIPRRDVTPPVIAAATADPASLWPANLRAERSGLNGGRTYSVAVACSDASGTSASTTVPVSVPHDQSGGH